MDNLTPQQENQIKSWSEERDSLLNEIVLLRNIKDVLISKANGEGISGNDILVVLGEVDKLNSKKEILIKEISTLNTEKQGLTDLLKDKNSIEGNIVRLKSQEQDLIKKNASLTTSLLSKEEQADIKTYLDQIADLRDTKERLIKENNEIAESKSEMTKNLHITVGRIEELKKKENEFTEMMAIDNTEKLMTKTRLQEQISSLEKEVKFLEDKKKDLNEDIVNQKEIYNDLFDKAGTLRDIVGHVVAISDKNIIKLEQQSSILVDKVKEVVELSTENINKHNVVLEKIPELFIELKRKSLEREPLKKIKHTP